MSDKEPVCKKPKINYKRFQYHWFDENPSWRIWVNEVPGDVTKFFCKACKSVLTCGLSEIRKHAKTESHLKNMEKFNQLNKDSETVNKATHKNDAEQFKMTYFLNQEENFNFKERVKIAEIKLATFFVEKNIPFSISSDLLALIQDIGQEPSILQAMTLERKKLTAIINKVVCRRETDRISKVLRENKFSVYEDETSDITNDKWLSLMVRYVEPKTLHVRCELLQMIHLDATDCSADKMFEFFKNELLKKDISLQLIVGLACDNASVMVGKSSSFKTKLSEHNSNLITIPCVCHSAALAAKEACRVIPEDCEHFLKGISAFINSSPKRTAIFKDFAMAYKTFPSTILKYAETRWLTRHTCIERILQQWDTLGKFLMEQAYENIQSANNLYQIFQKPSTKAYFLFLEFTLNIFNTYNATFQTRESLSYRLLPLSWKLLLWFLQKFTKPDLLRNETFRKTIEELKFTDRNNQLSLKEIDFGLKVEEHLKNQLEQKNCSEIEVDLIKEHCLQFYIVASEQICKRLPVMDLFLFCIATFESKSALFDSDRKSTFRNILYVNNKLGGIIDENTCEKEWNALYKIDSTQKEEWSKLSFDDMWTQISSLSTDKGELCFPNLQSLANIVRTLPHSNAEAERVFSLLPDAKTKKRNRLSNETLNSICVIQCALKDSNTTARTMKITREHLDLMTTDNLYRQTMSPKPSNLTLYPQSSESDSEF